MYERDHSTCPNRWICDSRSRRRWNRRCSGPRKHRRLPLNPPSYHNSERPYRPLVGRSSLSASGRGERSLAVAGSSDWVGKIANVVEGDRPPAIPVPDYKIEPSTAPYPSLRATRTEQDSPESILRKHQPGPDQSSESLPSVTQITKCLQSAERKGAFDRNRKGLDLFAVVLGARVCNKIRAQSGFFNRREGTSLQPRAPGRWQTTKTIPLVDPVLHPLRYRVRETNVRHKSATFTHQGALEVTDSAADTPRAVGRRVGVNLSAEIATEARSALLFHPVAWCAGRF